MRRCSYCSTDVHASEDDSSCPDCGRPLDEVSDAPAVATTETTATRGAVSGQKRRHGCLSAYLVAVIVVNSVFALYYLLGGVEADPGIPSWVLAMLVLAGVSNVVCAIALLKLKKWGFWGLLVSVVALFWLNILIGVVPLSILGVLAIPMLYGVLSIGKEIRGWP